MLVNHKLQSLQHAQQEIAQVGREIIVKDQIRKVISTLLLASNSIASIINASPHAATAWAGIFIIFSVRYLNVSRILSDLILANFSYTVIDQPDYAI
jgi:hypothetical protein